MRPRALDDRRIVLQQIVQFVDERPDFAGEFSLKPGRLADPDGDQRGAQPAQRLQAEAHLHQQGGDQPEPQRAERPGERRVEGPDFTLDLGQIAGDAEAIVLARAGKGDVARAHAQRVAVRAGCRGPADLPRLGRRPIGQALVPQRTGAQRFHPWCRDLPVPARIDLLEAPGSALRQRRR